MSFEKPVLRSRLVIHKRVLVNLTVKPSQTRRYASLRKKTSGFVDIPEIHNVHIWVSSAHAHLGEVLHNAGANLYVERTLDDLDHLFGKVFDGTGLRVAFCPECQVHRWYPQ